MKEVSLKDAQSTLQKTITWIKKLVKGRQEWEVACWEASLSPRKLKTLVKTRFVSKVVLFQETLEYAYTITICDKSSIFAFTSPCSIWSDLGYCKGND